MSTSSASPTTGPVVVPGDRLTTAGVGGLLLGMPISELMTRGVVVPKDDCSDPIPSLTAQGVFTFTRTQDGRIHYIEVRDARHPTLSGVAVGMPVASVTQTYGSKVTLESLTFDGTTVHYVAYVFHSDGVAMIFGASSPSSSPTDTVQVIAIMSDKEPYGLPYEYEC